MISDKTIKTLFILWYVIFALMILIVGYENAP